MDNNRACHSIHSICDHGSFYLDLPLGIQTLAELRYRSREHPSVLQIWPQRDTRRRTITHLKYALEAERAHQSTGECTAPPRNHKELFEYLLFSEVFQCPNEISVRPLQLFRGAKLSGEYFPGMLEQGTQIERERKFPSLSVINVSINGGLRPAS